LELLDLPAFPTDGITDAYLRYGVVGLGADWTGSAVYRSDDNGANYALMQTLTAQSTHWCYAYHPAGRHDVHLG
jgi:hypothetical protein